MTTRRENLPSHPNRIAERARPLVRERDVTEQGVEQYVDLVAGDIPDLDASKITTGAFNTDRIPSLDASKVTTGSFDADRIPSLDASKITTGVLGVARIPDLDASKITTGTFAVARIPTLTTAILSDFATAVVALLSSAARTITSIWNFTQTLRISDGTTSAPGLAFNSDTDTGFILDSGRVKIVIGGTEVASIDSLGNLRALGDVTADDTP